MLRRPGENYVCHWCNNITLIFSPMSRSNATWDIYLMLRWRQTHMWTYYGIGCECSKATLVVYGSLGHTWFSVCSNVSVADWHAVYLSIQWWFLGGALGSPMPVYWFTWCTSALVYWFTWCTGALVYWFTWCTGSLVLWCTGSPGSLVHWFTCWCHGSLVSDGSVYLRLAHT